MNLRRRKAPIPAKPKITLKTKEGIKGRFIFKIKTTKAHVIIPKIEFIIILFKKKTKTKAKPIKSRAKIIR